MARYERFRNRYAAVLRCDLYRYFPSIDHAMLKADVRRRIRCERTLWLIDAIIDGSTPRSRCTSTTPATTCSPPSSAAGVRGGPFDPPPTAVYKTWGGAAAHRLPGHPAPPGWSGGLAGP